MLLPGDHEELRWQAEAAVCMGWRRSQSATATPDEVDHTYRLMRWSTRYLAKLWQPVFARRGIALRITGVFCHKTPLATFNDVNGKKNTCELGDLLVVHDHLGRQPRRRATILQAKRTNLGRATATDPVQNDLYRRLPPFSLSRTGYRSTRLKKGIRDLGAASDFTRFALVADDAYACHWLLHPYHASGGLLLLPRDLSELRPAWSVAHPMQNPVTTVGAEMLGSFLSSMIFETYPARGQDVSPVLNLAAATLGSGQDLDITVQELLDLTAKRVAKSKQSWGGLRRGIIAFQSGMLPVHNPGNPFSELSSRPHPHGEPPDGAASEERDEDGEGLPILLIETFGD